VSALQKIAGFILGLAVVFVAAFGIGATVGPQAAERAADHSMPSAEPAATAELPAGLSSTEDGYTLHLEKARLDAGQRVLLRFRITDAAGAAVTHYVDSHEKQLHLIVVRRDMVGYQHVHPVMTNDGTWSVPVDLSAGDYRVFADFIPEGGDALTLGGDLHVAGRYDPQSLPPAATAAKVDEYMVTMTGDAAPNDPSTLTFSVTHNGKPVKDLQPYLGAYGHLVALRASDLAYLHVHPMGEPGDGNTPAGPEIAFGTTIPSNGDYRLFLDFKHENIVRTAEFTFSVDGQPQSVRPVVPSAEPEPEPEPGHGH
jgi:hypothetical protein